MKIFLKYSSVAIVLLFGGCTDAPPPSSTDETNSVPNETTRLLNISGYVIDGCVANAKVFNDKNKNMIFDTDEENTYTDTKGHYSLSLKNISTELNIVTIGGKCAKNESANLSGSEQNRVNNMTNSVNSPGAAVDSIEVAKAKADRLVNEVSRLAEVLPFYKTTQVDNNYASVSVTKLVDAGIVSSDDVMVSTATGTIGAYTDVKINNRTSPAYLVPAANYFIKSKAVPGFFYYVAPTRDNRGIIIATAASESIITVGNVPTVFGRILESSYSRFGAGANLKTSDTQGVVADNYDVSNIGLTTIVFK